MTANLEFKMIQHELKWNKCRKCPIGSKAFKHVVGEGAYPATYLFVGEGPGISEDVLGLPFIGKSGRLLRGALENAEFNPNEYYITNLVACRPCNSKNGPNRAPNGAEILNCSERIESLLKIVQPKIIVAVGAVAGDWIFEMYSQYRIRSIKHPAFILRNGGEKGSLYKDWFDTIKFIKKIPLED